MLNREFRCGLLLVFSLVLASVVPASRCQAADDKPAPKTVRMVLDYGDGVEKHFTKLAWSEGMTVLDALVAASKHRRGIKIQYRGKGATAFLTKIDDLENEGFTRNWVYRVNNKLAQRSFGIFTLKPGDTILWKFGEYR